MIRYLAIFIPIALALRFFHADPLLIFATAALGIIPLAHVLTQATEVLAAKLGPTAGGLLNASIGNAPEVVIGLFAISKGYESVVKASITGSILGNLLLGMGLSRFVGGIRHNVQRYNRAVAMTQSGLLLMAGAGLIVPAVFSFTTAEVTSEISDEISAVLFGLYAASLVFTLRTHKHYLAKGQVHPPAAASAAERTIHSKALESTPAWSPRTALVWLTVASLLLAALSEVLTDALAPAALRLGLSEIFTGIFLLAIVGNAAELMSATRFAAKDQMDLAVGSTLGAATQVALLVAPILIFGSHWLGHPMDLKFSQFEVISITIAIVISRQLSGDGESTWLEGLMLLAVYAILGIGFFYLRVGPA